MLLKIFLLILSLSCVQWANAQNNKKQAKNKIDEELAICLDKPEGATTAGMCNCTYEALEKWDKKLNVVYKALIAKLDTIAKPKLIEAQRQWIRFKEKEIELIDATYGRAQGTMWRIVRVEQLLQLTQKRAIELEYLLDTAEEFE